MEKIPKKKVENHGLRLYSPYSSPTHPSTESRKPPELDSFFFLRFSYPRFGKQLKEKTGDICGVPLKRKSPLSNIIARILVLGHREHRVIRIEDTYIRYSDI